MNFALKVVPSVSNKSKTLAQEMQTNGFFLLITVQKWCLSVNSFSCKYSVVKNRSTASPTQRKSDSMGFRTVITWE